MSHENARRAYRVAEAFNRRDLDAFLGFMAPDLEFTTRIIRVHGERALRGHEGIRAWWEDLLAAFPDFSFEVLEVREVGQFTIVSADARGHGAG